MPIEHNNTFRLSTICIAIITIMTASIHTKVNAREFFDPAFISSVNGGDTSNIPDLSVYQSVNAQAPGDYRVDVVFNGRYLETKNVKFITDTRSNKLDKKLNLIPCFTLDVLSQYGVRVKSFPELKESEQGCSNFDIIPDSKTIFDFAAQRLDISVPQAAISTVANDYIPPEKFDDGINAMFVNYQFNGSQDYKSDNEYYSLNLESGINIGPWRVRNLSMWNKSKGESDHFDSAYLYLQRSLRSISSNLIIGESSSLSGIFDSVPFSGVQLATDTSMLPESMRGYAPVIRGIAKTNARVVIKQNGYQVYQTYVAPGAFEITDMYPSGGSGDLYVTVEESDGSRQNFIVPFAVLPVMLREKQFEYEITSGKYRPYVGTIDDTPFTQATAKYGLTSSATIFGGVQASAKYQALSSGIGYNLASLGALSADVTQAWSKKRYDDKTSGQSWRLRYGKNIIETGTNFTIAGYRYSTKGFNTLSEVLNTYAHDGYYYSGRSLRNRTNFTLNQSLGRAHGSVSISALVEDYWDNKRTNKSLSLGYNGGWRGINYYLGYSYSRYTWGIYSSGRESRNDQRVALTISIPLSNWLPNTYASYQITESSPGSTDQYVSVGGIALEDNNLDWNIQQGYSNREYYSGDIRGAYNGSRGSVSAGYSYDNNSRRFDYGANGSLIAHADGITLGQNISNAAVLIKAPGLDNVRLSSDSTIVTDGRGYAIVPYITPYRSTDITLDSTSFGEEMELMQTTQRVVPTRGAIVRTNYAGNIGLRAFIHLKTPSGREVPFGAMVTLSGAAKSQASIVSDAGMVYMTGLQPTGVLTVSWGKKAGQQCTAIYTLSAGQKKNSGVSQAEALCR
ncbi:fimbria/pilus outer membrane usher protein [Raoultella ornithinolytica]|uniref:fimbria/pilus outer membrane usher protein n=1 Tax=Raoultella ornithinolytica TaxID=54291 RepID=UPI000F4C52D9|nr:fimbria/pilus outer membrane usher protein [Raoultella ornithinolytica]AYW53162.1 fimbrial biogenesis outer membrane usher protein [Raoultella ornithinolytica]EKQ8002393.1 fimbrial biogenesis outer membrane usher protein [Raoultella ornithinolytica]EKT9524366.1 fimbrial biogenesis outer membrane usher protein [Raoultella ornithinolytica]EKU0200502.1 fimbrial biogenesis outer membrane usher protein [Raoultella ornithinolytica]EKV4103438.1 fimbrial biogenesis outer membrane usher protein [Rao